MREDDVIRPGGKDGIFGVVEMVAGVTVLALTPDKNALLAREYKYAVARDTTECISGAIDGDETPLEAVKRELKEELGAESDNWTNLGTLDPFTTLIACPNYIYLAENIRVSAEQQTDEGEIIKIEQVPFDKVVEMVSKSEITHGASVAAILKARLVLNR